MSFTYLCPVVPAGCPSLGGILPAHILCAAGGSQPGSCGGIHLLGPAGHLRCLWHHRPPQVLASALAGLPLLDEHIHSGAPHSSPHSLQACQQLERRQSPAERHCPLRLPQMVRAAPPSCPEPHARPLPSSPCIFAGQILLWRWPPFTRCNGWKRLHCMEGEMRSWKASGQA